jgi:hypothetical protein
MNSITSGILAELERNIRQLDRLVAREEKAASRAAKRLNPEGWIKHHVAASAAKMSGKHLSHLAKNLKAHRYLVGGE